MKAGEGASEAWGWQGFIPRLWGHSGSRPGAAQEGGEVNTAPSLA